MISVPGSAPIKYNQNICPFNEDSDTSVNKLIISNINRQTKHAGDHVTVTKRAVS